MKALVTGSAGHLGEALARTLKNLKHEVVGLDIIDSPFTTHVGSIADRSCVRRCLSGVQAVFHAATMHKPHVATHSRQDFIDTNSLARSICWKRQWRQVSSPLSSRAQPASLATPWRRRLELQPPGSPSEECM